MARTLPVLEHQARQREHRRKWVPRDESERRRELSFVQVYKNSLPDFDYAQFPRPTRIAAIEDALACDQVLTREQLMVYFQAEAADLAHLPSISHVIEPVHMRSTRVSAVFYALEPESLRSRPSMLAHLVGTAAGRLRLGAPTANWKVSTGSADDAVDVEPDAVFTAPDGNVFAVEYDRHTYNRKKVMYKVASFSRNYDGTIWVLPPPVLRLDGKVPQRNRKSSLESMIALAPELRNIKHPVNLLTACWWEHSKILQP